MARRPLRTLLLGIAALLLAGCDAAGGASFRFEVRDEASQEPVEGALVRMFWFDDPEEVLGRGPVESRAAEVGEARWHGCSYGLTQKDWIEARTDTAGAATLRGETFYAGALFLPIHDLVVGAREGEPTGLWIRVHAGGDPSLPHHDFLIADGFDGPEPVRISWDGRHPPEATRPAGTIQRVPSGKREPKYCWRVVIPVER